MEESQAESETSSDGIRSTRIRKRLRNDSSSFEASEDEGSSGSSGGKAMPLSIAELQTKQTNVVHQRWKKLRKDYSSEYADLFRATFGHDPYDDGVPSVNLPSTQVGAVTWTLDEKLKLYKATARMGRLDILGITAAVGSKSQLEVQDYLQFLQESQRDTHLFARHVHSISHADIPAAVEISRECEEALEKAADALAAKQDEFDIAAVRLKGKDVWVVDRAVAKQLDTKADESEDLSDDEHETLPASAQMFQMTKFIELSERIFMNPGGPNVDLNWRRIARQGERPGLTYDAVQNLHDLLANLTRRLMQTALFLAQSRIRSLTAQGYFVQSVVKRQDIKAALDVLGMTMTPWSYWIRVARRSQLRVISGAHKRGETTERLTYDSLEALLAVKTKDYRKSQSMTTEESSTEDSEDDSDIDTSSGKDDQSGPATQANSLTVKDTSGSDLENASTEAEDSDSDERVGLAFHATASNKKRKQILLELEQDRMLERLDGSASQREEAYIWTVLGKSTEIGSGEDETKESSGPRPKVLRRTRDELRDWVGQYEAEWEHFGAEVPRDSFIETELQRKKRKLDSSQPQDIQERELPLR